MIAEIEAELAAAEPDATLTALQCANCAAANPVDSRFCNQCRQTIETNSQGTDEEIDETTDDTLLKSFNEAVVHYANKSWLEARRLLENVVHQSPAYLGEYKGNIIRADDLLTLVREDQIRTLKNQIQTNMRELFFIIFIGCTIAVIVLLFFLWR